MGPDGERGACCQLSEKPSLATSRANAAWLAGCLPPEGCRKTPLTFVTEGEEQVESQRLWDTQWTHKKSLFKLTTFWL